LTACNAQFSFSVSGRYVTCRDSQHAFPHDFRSGPSVIDWDPSKWIILTLYRLGLATGLRRAREDDLKEATIYMHRKTHHGISPPEDDVNGWEGEVWNLEQVQEYVKKKTGRCVVLVNGFVLDATGYLGEHVRPDCGPKRLISVNSGPFSPEALSSCVNTRYNQTVIAGGRNG
jgi:hypothetical protein